MTECARSELDILQDLARQLNGDGAADQVVNDGKEFVLVNSRWKLPLGNFEDAKQALTKIIENRKTRRDPAEMKASAV
jgi:hypothetical protein